MSEIASALMTPRLTRPTVTAHKPQSLENLQFARDAGAVPIWVPWRGGRVEGADGVAVIDRVELATGPTELTAHMSTESPY